MTQDRVAARSLPIAHDFLATMLGTARPSVSEAAGVLQKKKLIEYARGAVKIVNRRNLKTPPANAMRLSNSTMANLA